MSVKHLTVSSVFQEKVMDPGLIASIFWNNSAKSHAEFEKMWHYQKPVNAALKF